MRNLPVSVRVRAANDGEPQGIVEGVASVFNTDYAIGNRLNESVKTGALDDSIRARNGVIPVYLHHGGVKRGEAPIGHANVGTDGGKLNVEAQLYIDAGERARSVFYAMDAGAISEWSVGMDTPNDTDVRIRANPDGSRTEEILRADLLEVSIVLRGAHPGTYTTRTREADDDAAQIEQAQQALAIIARLIPGEAAGLADGDYSEIYDISELIDAYRSLYWFVQGEQAEIAADAAGDYELLLREKAVKPAIAPELSAQLSSARVRNLLRSSALAQSVTHPDATAS